MTNPAGEAEKREIAAINALHKKEVSEHLLRWHAHYNNEYTLWGLETIKHIALISLAGLGGVFALISSGKMDSDLGVDPALLFASSSLCAIFCMYFAMLWRGFHGAQQLDLLTKVRGNKFPEPKEYEYSRKTRITSMLADALGWAAAILMIVGGVVLFYKLKSL